MPEKTTVSIIKSDVGSLAGHHVVPKPLLDIGKKRLKEAQNEGLINSYYVFNAGDDLELLMVHQKGKQPQNPQTSMEHFQRGSSQSHQTLWRRARPFENGFQRERSGDGSWRG